MLRDLKKFAELKWSALRGFRRTWTTDPANGMSAYTEQKLVPANFLVSDFPPSRQHCMVRLSVANLSHVAYSAAVVSAGTGEENG